jgi:hypothetical protein
MKNKNIVLLLLAFSLFTSRAAAQDSLRIEKEGWSLDFLQPSTGFASQTKEQLIDLYFKVYPQLVKDFNPEATRVVKVKIDTAYDGVAYASRGQIVISSHWLAKNPGDIDVLTHELMHIVQAYPGRSGPGWLVEGIADYVRYKYGIAHEAAGWQLPALKEDHHYTSSYRVTARFIAWVEETQSPGIVKLLDQALRNRQYKVQIWEEQTGKSLDDLWQDYKNTQS